MPNLVLYCTYVMSFIATEYEWHQPLPLFSSFLSSLSTPINSLFPLTQSRNSIPIPSISQLNPPPLHPANLIPLPNPKLVPEIPYPHAAVLGNDA